MQDTQLLTVHFVGVETSLHTIIDTFVHIFACSPEKLAELVAEAGHVNSSLENGVWTRRAIDKLVKIDSAIHESIRLCTFKATGLARTISNPKGVVLPSGQHLPKGTKVDIANLAQQTDEDPDLRRVPILW